MVTLNARGMVTSGLIMFSEISADACVNSAIPFSNNPVCYMPGQLTTEEVNVRLPAVSV